MENPEPGRNKRRIISVIFVLILLSAIAALFTDRSDLKQTTRMLIFGGTIVLGCLEAYYGQLTTRDLFGAGTLAVGGGAGLYFEINGVSGFEKPIVIVLLILGFVLVNYSDWTE